MRGMREPRRKKRGAQPLCLNRKQMVKNNGWTMGQRSTVNSQRVETGLRVHVVKREIKIRPPMQTQRYNQPEIENRTKKRERSNIKKKNINQKPPGIDNTGWANPDLERRNPSSAGALIRFGFALRLICRSNNILELIALHGDKGAGAG